MGGKLGVEVRSSLCAEKMSDLAKYSLGELQARFGDKTGYASQLFCCVSLCCVSYFVVLDVGVALFNAIFSIIPFRCFTTHILLGE